MKMGEMRLALGLCLVVLGLSAFGRGEGWLPKPPAPPPVATLTNEARYVEWKWREDVTDQTTGVTQERAREKMLALAEELKDAQRHPEKYENLQVRVCGWNVRWNDLPKVEQDAYIRRAEEIAR